MRRALIGFGILVALSLLAAVAWLAMGRPPPGWVLRHGLPPAGGPTGRTVEIDRVRFVEIGAGYYRMGSEHLWDRGDLLGRLSSAVGLSWGKAPGRPTNEMPVRWVEIREAHWLAETEVTNAQYERFDPEHRRDWPGDEEPVTGVDWEKARSYCDWLSTRGTLSVRLPSEAEWEYACRAGSESEFCFGDDEAGLPEYGWYSKNSGKRAHAVGTRRANAWGLFDLHGNVSEWCADDCGPYEKAPRDGTAKFATRDSSFRVGRGGGLSSSPRDCRSAYRGKDVPSRRGSYLGFRPAASGH